MGSSNLRLSAIWLCLVLAAAPLLRSADTIPRQFDVAAFARLVKELSEDAGYFRFQFMSNEREFPSVIPELKKAIKPGGVYLGVGPEQNFTYIAATHPKIAFIFDIRRENAIEHLLYKSLFEMSPTRAEFLSRLFSRRPTADLSVSSNVRNLFQAFSGSRPDRQLFNQNRDAVKKNLARFELNDFGLAEVDSIYETIFDAGPGIDYSGPFGNFRGQSYAAIQTATDDHGQAWSYLASEENYQYVRDMELHNMIVPVVGNFAGPKAVRAVGKYLKDHGAVVSVYYTSNVEQYLFQQADDWRKYYANVATLPLDAGSTFIRSSHYSFNSSGQRRQQFGGTNYVMLLCSMSELTKAFNAGRIQSYDDVIRMSYE
jgi:hypothetical protein